MRETDVDNAPVTDGPESGGHQNAAYEADVDHVDPVMQDQVDGKSQKLSTQNGGQDNAAFQSDEYVEPAPRIPDIQHSNAGYLDLDENSRHKYQGLTQNGASNHRPSEKNGSIDDHKYYDIDLGTEANEYENPDFLRHKGEQNQPYGFNHPASYKFKGKTEHEENEAKKRQTCSKGTCFIVIFFILLLAALIGVAVFLLFEFVFNKPPQVTTTRPTHMVTTVAFPEPSCKFIYFISFCFYIRKLHSVMSSAVATIDMPYDSSLDNSSSPEYQALESSFSNLMNDAFSNSDISGTYEGVIVNGFSPGSILVHFDILITIDQGELPNAPPNGDPAQEIAYVAAEVEAQVTNVLVAVSMDNSSSLPIAAVNVTGTSAELLEMTTERETTYQPKTTEQEMTTQLATTQETTVNCTLFDYLCLDGTQCIPYSQYCDGLIDCNDGSDEPSFCSLAPCNYTTEYACDDQTQCYPHYKFVTVFWTATTVPMSLSVQPAMEPTCRVPILPVLPVRKDL
ncbi:uncharacterized protein [Diadema antillarum]|uniref:uncharacterized protein n=1 Tax=Diadema antillarum TaxID=105358 RepID=UPI003A887B88